MPIPQPPGPPHESKPCPTCGGRGTIPDFGVPSQDAVQGSIEDYLTPGGFGKRLPQGGYQTRPMPEGPQDGNFNLLPMPRGPRSNNLLRNMMGNYPPNPVLSNMQY